MPKYVRTVEYMEHNILVTHELYADDTFIAFPAQLKGGIIVIDRDAIKTGGADLTVARDATVARDFAVANYWTKLMKETVLPIAALPVKFEHGRFPERPSILSQWRDYSDQTEETLAGRGLTPTATPEDGYRRTTHMKMRPPHPSWADRILHMWVTASGRHTAERLALGLAAAKLENLWVEVAINDKGSAGGSFL